MDTETPQQQRAEAIIEALSATDAVHEAEEDQDIESLAQRLEAKRHQAEAGSGTEPDTGSAG